MRDDGGVAGAGLSENGGKCLKACGQGVCAILPSPRLLWNLESTTKEVLRRRRRRRRVRTTFFQAIGRAYPPSDMQHHWGCPGRGTGTAWHRAALRTGLTYFPDRPVLILAACTCAFLQGEWNPHQIANGSCVKLNDHDKLAICTSVFQRNTFV